MKLNIINFKSLLLSLIMIYGYQILAQQDSNLFQQANQQCLQGNYAQACKVYDTIENKGFAVLYNMQLCYVRQGKIGQALLYGKRAERQASFHQLTQLYELFDCIKRETDEDYTLEWYDQLAIFIKKCILSISMILLQLLILFLIVLGMIFWYRSWRLVYKRLFLMIVSMGFLCMVLWYYKMSIAYQPVGIVVKNEINLFAGPDASFYKKSQLHEADEMVVLKKQQGYYQVQAKKEVGWVCDNDIELV